MSPPGPGQPDRGPGAELVQLYDAEGRPDGTATRERVRRENLTHAATAVVLRDPLGRVYVHRRTDHKDVYPDLHDFAAGGVVAAGEDPQAAAVRELAEELGVTGVALEPIGVAHYRDGHTDYWCHCFTATWDGPVRWQPEEVAWGDWWPLERLAAALDGDPGAWVPDIAGVLGGWVRERVADRRVVDTPGWDSHAEVVEGHWLDRVPRRPEVREALLVEARLMPRLAPRLPLAVPVPAVLEEEPLRLRHPLVTGSPVDPARLTADDGRRVGEFLRALHESPEATWVGTGITADADRVAELDRMAARVVPMLPAELREAGTALAARCRAASQLRVLRHGDLGPPHLLATDGRVSGVIDWTDVALGDPALDLAWTVNRTPPEFAGALVAAYRPSRDELARGRDWDLLGPWWEVWYGLHDGGDAFVTSGLEGVRERLQQG